MTSIESSISGRIIAVLVHPGDQVALGTPLLIVDCMKTEIPVEAETAGVVSEVLFAEGEEVKEGQIVVVLA